jgi:hypothetical protein
LLNGGFTIICEYRHRCFITEARASSQGVVSVQAWRISFMIHGGSNATLRPVGSAALNRRLRHYRDA